MKSHEIAYLSDLNESTHSFGALCPQNEGATPFHIPLRLVQLPRPTHFVIWSYVISYMSCTCYMSCTSCKIILRIDGVCAKMRYHNVPSTMEVWFIQNHLNCKLRESEWNWCFQQILTASAWPKGSLESPITWDLRHYLDWDRELLWVEESEETQRLAMSQWESMGINRDTGHLSRQRICCLCPKHLSVLHLSVCLKMSVSCVVSGVVSLLSSVFRESCVCVCMCMCVCVCVYIKMCV